MPVLLSLLDHAKTQVFSGLAAEKAGLFFGRYTAILSRNGPK